MAIRKVVYMGEEILRKKSKEVKKFDENLWELLDDMRETMYAFNGMGLAAPQVGVLKNVIIIENNNMFLELINPKIILQEGEDVEEEGCLSVKEMKGEVKRPYYVCVEAYDRMGYKFLISGEKYLARVLCHEIDHLNGVLFVDKIEKGNNKK